MASIKKIKKDMFLITDSLLLGHCVLAAQENMSEEQLSKMQDNIVAMHNNMMDKIRNYRQLSGAEEKTAKKYFKQLRIEMNDAAGSIIVQFSSLLAGK